MKLKLFTIGFTKHSAESFFTTLKQAHVKRIIDTRLNNFSQLAGFAKRDDLKYFLHELGNIDYSHDLELAPTDDLLRRYRVTKNWDEYSKRFVSLIKKRRIEDIDPRTFSGACLLCSEYLPHHCHRRLVAEYLSVRWKNVEIIHLQ